MYSPLHNKPVQVIEEKSLWGEKIFHCVIPGEKKVEIISQEKLLPLNKRKPPSVPYLIYAASASRIADSIETDTMISPLGGSLMPLPHQLDVLTKALSKDNIRLMLADEVGLGKTIEAGMIFKELKIRGLVKRVLVVAPKGLVLQWISEMKTHFDETFHLIIPGNSQFERMAQPFRVVNDSDEEYIRSSLNYWNTFDQAVCSLDSVKPLEKRRGWDAEQVDRYNRERFYNLMEASWDLVIIDEAHRVAGSTDTVARHLLGRGLADAAPYILLLSATPHSGKTDSFRRLMSLLDEESFADEDSLTRERVSDFVLRTEKRSAINFKGEKLFKPRTTRIHYCEWEQKHNLQKKLYDAVTEYVANGYNRAIREKDFAAGFLMVLLQRLVTSSTSAIIGTLEKRIDALGEQEDNVEKAREELLQEIDDTGVLDDSEFMRFYQFFKTKHVLELEEVNRIMELAEKCRESGPDAKAESLLNLLYTISSEEGDPELKFLVFTEFVSTQAMLKVYLEERGFSIAILNGSMSLEERAEVQKDFADKVRILISTDAGGEGLNLQFCHVIINYDIPWAPTKIEQRIGRVDRIGQEHPVLAFNFLLKDTVESRVFEVLQEKLEIIFREFGVDKMSDILDSMETLPEYRDLYINSIVNPGDLETEVDKVTQELLKRAKKAKERWDKLYNPLDVKLDEAEKLMGHPLPFWTEKMVVNYLLSNERKVEKTLLGYNLEWDDNETMSRITFSREKVEKGFIQHLSLEHHRVMKLVKDLPLCVQGDKIPRLFIKGLPEEVKGYWSLWRIVLTTSDTSSQRILALFRQEDGRIFKPTALRLWDMLLNGDSNMVIKGEITGDEAEIIYLEMEGLALQHGESLHNELKSKYNEYLRKEREKGFYAFNARTRAIERIGLPEVRNHRLRQLEKEKIEWEQQSKIRESYIPELYCIVLCHISGE